MDVDEGDEEEVGPVERAGAGRVEAEAEAEVGARERAGCRMCGGIAASGSARDLRASSRSLQKRGRDAISTPAENAQRGGIVRVGKLTAGRPAARP